MLIEQPPRIYRWLFPGAFWRIPATKNEQKCVYLTFDDGPIPEMTPWIINVLDNYKIKATFFCVGDNVKKYPELYKQLISRGHTVGNHTLNHVQGIRYRSKNYVRNVAEAAKLIDSKLFRPPHGHMRIPQIFRLRKLFKIVLWDVVTRDYSPHMTANGVFNNVKRYTRNGSIIVFHDSLKAKDRIEEALPKSIEWLMKEGYAFKVIDD
ncbi:MAG: polysaccharide deacetylase family protein [Tannerella sp.]|jgi:peptidoglycan/xylan/chitin deacetylase (PgdA/CDA1 family)|nr:polysaccharide deacetylase family protein [Tannerella sp.]